MNYNLNEELKNTVRRITEPCDKCNGDGFYTGDDSYENCEKCNGKGWCPELEFGCEIEFEQEGQKYIDVVAEVFEEKKIFRPVDAYTDAVSFYNINKNLGKPLETREILLAIRKKNVLLEIYNETVCVVEEGLEKDEVSFGIPLNIPPTEYSDELKKDIIKLLKK